MHQHRFHEKCSLDRFLKVCMTHLQNTVEILKRSKVTGTWNDSLWWQTISNSWIHCYNNNNATFDWQMYNFIIKASVQTLVANKEIKRKSGLGFCFLFLKWKVFSSKIFTLLLCQKPPAEEISWRSGPRCIKLTINGNVGFNGNYHGNKIP